MNMRYPVVFLMAITILLMSSCSHGTNYATLETELQEFAIQKDARIGIAVIVDSKDTVAINGDLPFPMLSVYKFPIALGIGECCRSVGSDFSDSCVVTRDDLHNNTWSPMIKKYGNKDTVAITIRELLTYAIQQSDNNASDILLELIGGAARLDSLITAANGQGIDIRWTEHEMHQSVSRSYDNTSTPIAMARLLDKFYNYDNDSLSLEIKGMMESCETGKDRLAKPLATTNTVIGHKTGTGDINADGRIIAVNDVGYVRMPEGHHYVIVVFISDSAYDLSETSGLIAEISSIVYNTLNH